MICRRWWSQFAYDFCCVCLAIWQSHFTNTIIGKKKELIQQNICWLPILLHWFLLHSLFIFDIFVENPDMKKWKKFSTTNNHKSLMLIEFHVKKCCKKHLFEFSWHFVFAISQTTTFFLIKSEIWNH
jgi:hypothetical protein